MEIKATPLFIKSAKPLAKRYRSFNDDYQNLLSRLENNSDSGVDLGEGFHKVRMAIKAKGKGKSGGCRVITFDTIERDNCLYLLYVYDKSEHASARIEVLRQYARELGII